MALVVFLQEDENVQSLYRNLKIFCETAPWTFELSLGLGQYMSCGSNVFVSDKTFSTMDVRYKDLV